MMRLFFTRKMYNAEVKQIEVSLGEEMEILVLKGKGDSIISRMKDGRVILFNRENPGAKTWCDGNLQSKFHRPKLHYCRPRIPS